MFALSSDALINTIRWAVDVYRHDPELHLAMQRQAMGKEMGWDIAARSYDAIYRWAVAKRRG